MKSNLVLVSTRPEVKSYVPPPGTVVQPLQYLDSRTSAPFWVLMLSGESTYACDSPLTEPISWPVRTTRHLLRSRPEPVKSSKKVWR